MLLKQLPAQGATQVKAQVYRHNLASQALLKNLGLALREPEHLRSPSDILGCDLCLTTAVRLNLNGF